MTRCSSRSLSARTVWISSVSILPTGIPVQPEMTSAMVCESTQACMSGVSPCTVSSSLLSSSSSALSAAGSGGGAAGVAGAAAAAGAGGADFAPGPAGFASAAFFFGAASSSSFDRTSRIFPISSRSLSHCAFRPTSFSSAAAFFAVELARGAPCGRRPSPPRARGPRSRQRCGRSSRCASSTAGGVAAWPIATRAQAVSRTADRLVRQLAPRDVAVRQPDGVLHGLVEDADLVVLLERLREAAHHDDADRPRSAPRP